MHQFGGRFVVHRTNALGKNFVVAEHDFGESLWAFGRVCFDGRTVIDDYGRLPICFPPAQCLKCACSGITA